MSISQEQIDAARAEGIIIERIEPAPVNYKEVLIQQRLVLQGLEVAMSQRMVPDYMREAVYAGALQGQLKVLDEVLWDIPYDRINIIMNAIQIQRSALNKQGL